MSEKYLDNNGTQILINQIKGNCTQKRSTLPIASVDELGNTYQYTGTTSGSLVHGYFYECVSDGQDPATYSWQNVSVQPTAGTPTAATTTFDNTTSGLQATNVQDAIDEVDGIVDSVVSDVSTLQTDVSNIQGVIPSTATTTNQLVDHDSLGTAASKDFTTNVSPNNHALVESNAVYSAINNALTSVYTPRGNIACADLTSSLLVASNVGNVYNTTDSGTTTALFMQGAGIPIPQNSTVGIIQTSPNTYLFNLMGNTIDLHDYQKQELTNAVEGATTVEGALGALDTKEKDDIKDVYEITGKSGVKNLLPNTAKTQTTDSITFTVNSDGTITANGTATGEIYFPIFITYNSNEYPLISGKQYHLSGCPLGGSLTSFRIYLEMNGVLIDGTHDIGDGVTFTAPAFNSRFAAYVRINNGQTIDNKLFKPMITVADMPNSDYAHYVPYAMSNQQITPYIQAISNRNLLDNPWFTINQRGLGTYPTPSSDKKFTVDRWAENYHATVVTNTNGVTITSDSSGDNADLGQTIEGLYSYLVGKLVTASVKLQNGNIYSKSGVLNANLVGAIRFDLENGFRCDVNTNSSNSYLGFYIYSGGNNPNASIAVRAVKLELGGVSTLAMDCPPNYTTELEKCKRFFEKNSWVSWIPCKAITNGSMMYGFTYRFDVQKRIANWNMTVDSTKGNSNGFLYDLTTGTTIPNAEIVISNSGSYNSRMVQIKITHSSIVAGHEYRYAIGDNVFEISADL